MVKMNRGQDIMTAKIVKCDTEQRTGKQPPHRPYEVLAVTFASQRGNTWDGSYMLNWSGDGQYQPSCQAGKFIDAGIKALEAGGLVIEDFDTELFCGKVFKFEKVARAGNDPTKEPFTDMFPIEFLGEDFPAQTAVA